MRPSFAWLSPFLTAIGQRIGIDAHYFAKNSALVLLGNGISVIRTFLSGYLVARLFSSELYGEYQFILSIVSILGLFTLPGLVHAVTRSWARNDPFSMQILLYKQLCICLVGSVVLLLAIPFLHYYNRQELWPLFVASAVVFPITPIAQLIFGSYTIAKARFDITLKANIIWSCIMIVATLGIVLFYHSALLMLVASMTIPSLVYLYLSRNITLPTEEHPQQNTLSVLRYGWGLTFSSLPVSAVWYIDKLLISQLFGMKQLALFSVALLIPEQVKLLVKQLMPIAFSKQAKGDDSWPRRMKLLKVVLIGTILFGIAIALYVAVSPWLIPWLFPNYDASRIILLTNVAAITVITNPSSLLPQYLEAQGMLRAVKWSNWLAAILFLIGIITLIPTYGLLGAVLARGVFRLSYTIAALCFIVYSPLQKVSVT